MAIFHSHQYALETTAFILNRAPSKSVETTPYEIWHGKKLRLSFMKVWGCEAYVKKLQPDKLEPKADKCIFVGYPKKTIGYTFYHPAEGKTFVAKTGAFLEKEFLAKGVGGRKIELDEIVDPSLHVPSGTTDDVLEPSSIVGAEVLDTDQGNHTEEHIPPCRSTRTHTHPEWYGDRILSVMLI